MTDSNNLKYHGNYSRIFVIIYIFEPVYVTPAEKICLRKLGSTPYELHFIFFKPDAIDYRTLMTRNTRIYTDHRADNYNQRNKSLIFV